MPKRGKAATRQARQRRAQSRPASRPVSSPALADRAEPMPQSTSGPSANRAERSPATAASSALSERARDEYHYVTRDLRNIGILAGVMLVVLTAAFVAFRALGIGPG
ncbi:MAG: hypothetical protein ABR509_02795 [Candidatus Limnocylindria bacterium]